MHIDLTSIAQIFIHVAHAQEADAAAGNPSVAAMFGLNWKLFIAQLINFGIVLFVLWKWVFKPVAKGLQDRTTRIEQSLKDAQNIDKQKLEFEQWKNTEMGKARTEASAIITQSKQEAETVKTDILNQARIEQERLLTQTQNQLMQEKQRAVSEAKGEIAGLVITATQRILGEKVDTAKDKELIKQALKDLV